MPEQKEIEWTTDEFIYHGPYGPPDFDAAQRMDELLAWAAETIPADSGLQIGFAHAERSSAWIDLTIVENQRLMRYKGFKSGDIDFYYKKPVTVLEEISPYIILPRAKWRQAKEVVADARAFSFRVQHTQNPEKFELEINFRPEVKNKLHPVYANGTIDWAEISKEDPLRRGIVREIGLRKEERKIR